mmetsp:Transcript_3998/g.9307  ORF Transcript_3998/g.9307 Transcript_3998/m.9307 type:complete len:719 (+) Transcript_3998:57-2213(+)
MAAAILVFALAALVCADAGPTPVEKVIDLLRGMQSSVEEEGKAEAASYDTFACFCKNTTQANSAAILKSQLSIDEDSASLEEKTELKAEKAGNLLKAKKKVEEVSAEKESQEAKWQQDKASYQTQDADLVKAIESITGSIRVLEASKPSANELLSTRQSVKRNLDLAEALKLVDEGPQWRGARVFLQEEVDPSKPDYKHHSQGIIAVLMKLEETFKGQKSEADSNWARVDASFKLKQTELTNVLDETAARIVQLEQDIDGLATETAELRNSLLQSQEKLKDEQLYSTDLTQLCETRAKDWDQRSKMRAGELEAIAQALDVLQGRVSPATKVNQRTVHPVVEEAPTVSVAPAPAPALSFLQGGMAKARSLLARQRRSMATGSERRLLHAIELMQRDGGRLRSKALAALASHLAKQPTLTLRESLEKKSADPFSNVKGLIQRLIERLLKEATEEATKKGFCDTELKKAMQDRDFRWAAVSKLNVELQKLSAKHDELAQEIDDLKSSSASQGESLESAKAARTAEAAENAKALSMAKEGLEAVEEAMTILRSFYTQAAKAGALLQASPVDEDTSGPGFKGAYKGKQADGEGVLGLLEVIKSDFERTLRVTSKDEKEAAAAFVQFERTGKSGSAGMDKKVELNQADLEATALSIEEKRNELASNMALVDAALKTVEELKPMCIDTGMSFEERDEKRRLEVESLKKALCILDPEQVEEDCASG